MRYISFIRHNNLIVARVGGTMRSSTLILLTVLLLVSVTNTFALYAPNQSTNSTDQIPNRLIVKLHSDIDCTVSFDSDGVRKTGVKEIDDLNTQLSVLKQEKLFGRHGNDLPQSLQNIFVLTLPESKSAEEAAELYSALESVEYAEPDRPVELYDTPDDPLYSHQWSFHNTGQGYYHVERIDGNNNDTLAIVYGTPDADIDFNEAYSDPPENTETVIVAIHDTGIDMDHPDLADKIWTNPGEIAGNGVDDDNNGFIDDVHGWDFAGDCILTPADNDPTDSYGHGTHCAGTVAAITDNAAGVAGIAPDCEIMPISFHPFMMSTWAAEGIIYAADNGADVINMSWGLPYQITIWESALEYAAAKGVVLIAAAGNDGYEQINYPAGYSTVIAVAASNSDDEITSFSTFGSNIHIAAPGRSILSLRADDLDMYAGSSEPDVHIIDDYYYLASGTSMASPHVVGVAAYLESVSPGISHNTVKDILAATSDDILDPYGLGVNLPGWDKYSGYGRLNLYNTLFSAPLLGMKITSPLNNESVSGSVDIYGIADGNEFTGYTLEYGEGRTPESWTEINSSGAPVSGGYLYTWDTSGLNGIYSIRLKSFGGTHESYVTVYVMNDATAEIATPDTGMTVFASSEIIGTAICPDFSRSVVMGGLGATPSTWTVLESISIPTVNGKLANLPGDIMEESEYTLRLYVYSTSALEAVTEVTFTVTTPFAEPYGWRIYIGSTPSAIPNWGDFDNDGVNEIVVGYDSGIKFFNLDGTEKTIGVPTPPSDKNYRLPAAVGDLDGDGVDDLVLVGDGTIYGYPSSEPSFDHYKVAPDFSAYYSVNENTFPVIQLIDIDGDNKDEIIYSRYGYFSYYGETVNAMQTFLYDSDGIPWNSADSAIVSKGNFQAADLDGDSQCEFYYFEPYWKSYYLRKLDLNLNLIDSIYLPELGIDQNVTCMSAVDVNGDYNLELVVLAHLLVDHYPASNHFVYALDESFHVMDGWPIDTGIDGYYIPRAPVFCDIERDGLLEFFTSYYDLDISYVYAHHIDGTPVIGDSLGPGLFAISPNSSYLHMGTIVDLDDDDYPEYCTSESPGMMGPSNGFNSHTILSWHNDGTLIEDYFLTVSNTAETSENTPYSPIYGDFNKNGYTEMLMTTPDGYLIYTEFEGSFFNKNVSSCPIWRYNRSLNNSYFPFGHGETIECGDADASGYVDIDDITFLIRYIFQGGPAPDPVEIGDVNCDGMIDIDDVVYLIMYVFAGGPAPCDPDGNGEPDC